MKSTYNYITKLKEEMMKKKNLLTNENLNNRIHTEIGKQASKEILGRLSIQDLIEIN